jgi:hypothetical protein
MRIAIDPIARPADEACVAGFETRHGVCLPQDYRRFMLSHNGGLLHNNTDGVRAFFCLDEHEYWGLDHWASAYRRRLPEDLLPIATDGHGNVYCLAHRGESAGAVFFADMEPHPDGDGADPAALTQLSDTFAAFLDNLEPFDPDDLPEVHEEDWDVWSAGGERPARPLTPPPMPVRVKRRPRHWSENMRKQQP